MEDDLMWPTAILIALVFVVCFVTYQIQTTNRKFIEAGFSYKPVAVSSYSTAWSK